MKCPKCGRINSEDALICWNCRVRFSDLKEKETEKTLPSHKRDVGESFTFKKKATYLLIGLGVSLIIVLAVAAYFFLRMP